MRSNSLVAQNILYLRGILESRVGSNTNLPDFWVRVFFQLIPRNESKVGRFLKS